MEKIHRSLYVGGLVNFNPQSRASETLHRRLQQLGILRDVNPLDGLGELGKAGDILGTDTVDGSVILLVNGDEHDGAFSLSIKARTTTTNRLTIGEDDSLQRNLGDGTTRPTLHDGSGQHGGVGLGFSEGLHSIFFLMCFYFCCFRTILNFNI